MKTQMHKHPFAERANHLQYGTPYQKRRVLGWKSTLALFLTALIAGWFI